MEIFLATENPGKRFEFTTLLTEVFGDLTVYDFSDWHEPFESAIEDGDTFEANAEKKAVHAAAKTGLISIADDSGICVDALGGAPGVYSARYAGENATNAANNKKLIEALQGVPPENRTARYVAVICMAIPGKPPIFTRGECEGVIVDDPRGDGGFGYDPHFLIPDWGLTTAEVSLEKKNTISHRAIALKKLGDLLRADPTLVA